MESILINAGGLALILFILWWFFFSTGRVHKISGETIPILVSDGTYQPARIQVPAGQKVVLRFTREDASPCAAQVVIADLDLSAELSLNHDTEVAVQFDQPGEYEFTCQMKMYRGTLVVS